MMCISWGWRHWRAHGGWRRAAWLCGLVLAWFSPTPALGADWTVVLRTGDDLVMVDAARLRRDGERVRAWERVLYRTPRPDAFYGNPPLTSRERLLEFDCAASRVRVLRVLNFAAGRVLRSEERYPAGAPFQTVAKGSPEAAALAFACRERVVPR